MHYKNSKAVARTSPSSGSSLHSSRSFPEPKLRPLPDLISSTMSLTGLRMQVKTESGFSRRRGFTVHFKSSFYRNMILTDFRLYPFLYDMQT